MSGRPVNKILVAGGAGGSALSEIVALARQKGVPVQKTDRRQLDKLARGANHQGVVARAAAKEYAELEDIVRISKTKLPLVILLDGVQDPHNLGAVLRVADAAGASGVVIPVRRSAQLTAAVARASAGAHEYVPVARVTNLAQALGRLKESGFWAVGADAAAGQTLWEADLEGPLAIVIGGEGRGISRLVKERCDILVRVPMLGRVSSLNASVACALLAYEVLRRKETAARGTGFSSR